MSIYRDCKLTYKEAEDIVNKYDNMSESEFEVKIRSWAKYDIPEKDYNPIYKELRDSVVSVFRQAAENEISYKLDLEVGLKLYELLNPDTGLFDLIDANDDDIWRYMSVKVMPDLTFIRYPNRREDIGILMEETPELSYSHSAPPEKDSIRLRKKRFYSHTRRIWLKTLWWYIYLSWQGDTDTTRQILKNNGTNIISHLIERPGDRGYRVVLFRSMMKTYSTLEKQTDSKFRAAAKLNLAKCVTVEPGLIDTENGEDKYSEILFGEIKNKDVVDSYDDI